MRVQGSSLLSLCSSLCAEKERKKERSRARARAPEHAAERSRGEVSGVSGRFPVDSRGRLARERDGALDRLLRRAEQGSICILPRARSVCNFLTLSPSRRLRLEPPRPRLFFSYLQGSTLSFALLPVGFSRGFDVYFCASARVSFFVRVQRGVRGVLRIRFGDAAG